MTSLLEGAIAAMQDLAAMQILQGRRLALAVLAEGRVETKAALAGRMVKLFEQASLLGSLLERGLDTGLGPSLWPEAELPERIGLIRGNSADAGRLARVLEAGERELATQLDGLSAWLSKSPVCAHFASHIAALKAGHTGASLSTLREGSPERLRKAFQGPLRTPLDPIFVVSTQASTKETRPLTDADHAPDFWRMSMREAMAGDQCCLSICELDAAPVALLRDLAKQAWDEMRHATLFLRCARDLLPEFISVSSDAELVEGAKRYLETGAGLVVPAEGNLYPALWSADLFDRLVLMQLDGEADLPADFTDDLSTSFYLRRPQLAEELAWTIREEQAHGELGKRWLQWLIPDVAERELAIERALRFRGFRMAIGIAAFQGIAPQTLLASLAQPPVG